MKEYFIIERFEVGALYIQVEKHLQDAMDWLGDIKDCDRLE